MSEEERIPAWLSLKA